MNVEYRFGQVVAGHLGGYVPGGDPNTTYPVLWDWLVETLGVRSVLDVGCGDGAGALSFFEGRGCDVLGIDGVPQGHHAVETHDFTTGPWRVRGNRIEGAYDLVWCCEFVEHVADEYVPNFLEAFLAADLVLMTHAVPGQGGHHHVNCREPGYWIARLAEVGYRVDPDLTLTARALALDEPIPVDANYFSRTGLAFVRD